MPDPDVPSQKLAPAGATRAERVSFTLLAGAATLWMACWFYASLKHQTTLTGGLPLARHGEWSAPLDDVFIHFDFARATARGYPFQWSEGNGYSSGGTSLLYPFVLSFGYWIGYRDLSLMAWAAIVACVCTFALLLTARRMFRNLPVATSYLVIPSILGIGVLSWSLFSGMEVALFLALWGAALVAWDDLVTGPPDDRERPTLYAGIVGFWGMLLVATRPEAASVVFVFAVTAAVALGKRRGLKRGLSTLALCAVPGALVVIGQSLANLLITGDTTAAGALVKLELHHPHLNRQQVLDAWWFHVRYQFMRVGDYHLSSVPVLGFLPYAFALLSLAFHRTRRYGVVLVGSAVLWVLIVALNGQVRWQNERYTMPALAWIMLAAALAIGAVLSGRPALGARGRRLFWTGTSVTLIAWAAFGWFHIDRLRDQVWFFGRASRNIRDQHVRTGRLLRAVHPPARRVLVGDAGAIPYVSDLPALDIIGLGGFHNMPFARATRQGVGAAVELIERIPADARPDVLAIYPSWWGTFPLWFGDVLGEVPVTGNVICGGASKVIYRPRWKLLDGSNAPFTTSKGMRVVDSVDVADIVSEKSHGYVLSGAVGYVEMKLLPHPEDEPRDVFDAGRLAPQGVAQSFVVRGLQPGRAAQVLFRAAPTTTSTISVQVNGAQQPDITLKPGAKWQESALQLPASIVQSVSNIRVVSKQSEHVLYHVFVLQPVP